MVYCAWYSHIRIRLVVSTPLKNISLLGCLSPNIWENKKMFQTTNQGCNDSVHGVINQQT